MKIGDALFYTILFALILQKTLLTPRIWNTIFINKILETHFENIFWPDKIHLRTKFGQIVMYYAMNMVITLAIWLESHVCS